jgi:F-type H+-transporting ATPase subunit beta
MMILLTDSIELNVALLKRRVPNLSAAVTSAGLQASTVSDLTTGKVPIGRAEIRTLVELANLAGCSLDELVLRVDRGGMVETGIKTIDLFAPLVRGGTAGVLSLFHGLGQLATVAEVMRSLVTCSGFSGVVWLPDDDHELEDHISTAQRVFREMVTPLAQVNVSRHEVAESVRAVTPPSSDVMIVAARGSVQSGELVLLKHELAQAGSRPVTYLLYDRLSRAEEAHGAPFGPLDAAWRFDMEMNVRDLYPAIDPVVSISSLLQSEQLEASHISLAGRARRLLRRYRELRPGVAARGLDKYPADEQLAYRRGERLEAFMTQPYFILEPWTHRPGASVPLLETLAGARSILDGEADDVPVDALRWLGPLSDSQAR